MNAMDSLDFENHADCTAAQLNWGNPTKAIQRITFLRADQLLVWQVSRPDAPPWMSVIIIRVYPNVTLQCYANDM